jgi:hypothetical protein
VTFGIEPTQTASPFARFAHRWAVRLTTYKRDGTPAGAAVDLAVAGDTAYFRTYEGTWMFNGCAATRRSRSIRARSGARPLDRGCGREHGSRCVMTRSSLPSVVRRPIHASTRSGWANEEDTQTYEPASGWFVAPSAAWKADAA